MRRSRYHSTIEQPAHVTAKDRLLSFLYKPAYSYMQERLKEIVVDNNTLHSDSKQFGEFYSDGVKYSYLPSHTSESYVHLYELDSSLQDRLTEYNKMLTELDQEKDRSTRALSIILSNVKNFQDLKEMLGDSLISPLADLSSKLRTEQLPLDKKAELLKVYGSYITSMQQRAMDNLICKNAFELK